MKTLESDAQKSRTSIVLTGLRTFKFLATNTKSYMAYGGIYILVLLASSIASAFASVQDNASPVLGPLIWIIYTIQMLSIVFITARSIRFTLNETMDSPIQKNSLIFDILLVVAMPLIVWGLPVAIAVYLMTELAAIIGSLFPDLAQETLNLSFGAVGLIGFVIYFSRTFCVVPATIFDHRLAIRKNWQETKGKTLGILFTFTALFLPFRFLSAFSEFPFSDRAWEMAPGGELQSLPWVLFFNLNTFVGDLGFAVVLPVFITLVFVSLRQSSDNAIALSSPARATSEDHPRS